MLLWNDGRHTVRDCPDQLIGWDSHHCEGLERSAVQLAPAFPDNRNRQQFAIVRRDDMLLGFRRRDFFAFIECLYDNKSAAIAECRGESRPLIDRFRARMDER